jgi:hypothetical protein
MSPKLYLTLDTSKNRNNLHDYTLYFDEEIDKKYNKICLKSLYIEHDNDVNKLFTFVLKKGDLLRTVYYPLYIHCSMLAKDDNMVNRASTATAAATAAAAAVTSDVIAVLYSANLGTKEAKSMFVKFNNSSGKLITHSNRIQLHLTNFDGFPISNYGKYYFIYELEFF